VRNCRVSGHITEMPGFQELPGSTCLVQNMYYPPYKS